MSSSTRNNFIFVLFSSDRSQLLGEANFPSTQKGDGFTTAYATVQEASGRELYFPLSVGIWNVKVETTDSELLLVSFCNCVLLINLHVFFLDNIT